MSGQNKEVKFSFAVDQQSVTQVKRVLTDLISMAERAQKALNGLTAGESKTSSSLNVSANNKGTSGPSGGGSGNAFGTSVNKSLTQVFLDNSKSLQNLATTGEKSMKMLTDSLKRAVNDQKQVLSQLDGKLAETEARFNKLKSIKEGGGKLSKFVNDGDLGNAQRDFVDLAAQRASANADLAKLQSMGTRDGGGGGGAGLGMLQALAQRAGVPPQIAAMITGGSAAFAGAGMAAGGYAVNGFNSLINGYGSGSYELARGASRGSLVQGLFNEGASGDIRMRLARGDLSAKGPRFNQMASASGATGSAAIDAFMSSKLGMLSTFGGVGNLVTGTKSYLEGNGFMSGFGSNAFDTFNKAAKDNIIDTNTSKFNQFQQFLAYQSKASGRYGEAVTTKGLFANRGDVADIDIRERDADAAANAMARPIQGIAAGKFTSSVGRSINYARMGYGHLSGDSSKGNNVFVDPATGKFVSNKYRLSNFLQREVDLREEGFSPEDEIAGGNLLQGSGGYNFSRRYRGVGMRAAATGQGAFAGPFGTQFTMNPTGFGVSDGKGGVKYGTTFAERAIGGNIDFEAGNTLSQHLLQMSAGSSGGQFDPTGMMNAIRSGMGFDGKSGDLMKTRRAIEGINQASEFTTGAISGQQKGVNALIASKVGGKYGLDINARARLESMKFEELVAGASGDVSKHNRVLGLSQKAYQDARDLHINSRTNSLLTAGNTKMTAVQRKMQGAGGGKAGLDKLSPEEVTLLAATVAAQQGLNAEALEAEFLISRGDSSKNIKGRRPSGPKVKGTVEGDELKSEAAAMQVVVDQLKITIGKMSTAFKEQAVATGQIATHTKNIEGLIRGYGYNTVVHEPVTEGSGPPNLTGQGSTDQPPVKPVVAAPMASP